jgi:hypothetical protein
MQATLGNIKKFATKSQRSAFKRKNIIEEGGASRSGVKKEQENTEARA